MYFYQCGFSLLHVVNQLSNYINKLHNEKKIVILHANTASFMCKAQDNAVANRTSTTEKKKSSKVLEKLDPIFTRDLFGALMPSPSPSPSPKP